MSIANDTKDQRVIPLSPHDQWRPINNIRSIIFIVVRDVLDDDLMRTSLDSLIRKQIPILGARIKPTGKNGALEYHLPKPFPENYELFTWSTNSSLSVIEEDKLVPKGNAEGGIAHFQSISLLETHLIPKSWPLERKNEKPGCPLLLVHLTLYHNATIIAMNLPHCVSDQMGFGSVVRAWTDIMRGDEPARFLDLAPEYLPGGKNIPRAELESKKHKHRLKSRIERMQCLVGIIPELVMAPSEERRILFLPEGIVRGVRDRCNKTLNAKYGANVPEITNGDVLASITAKFGNMHRKTPRRMLVTGPANLRGIHPALPKDRLYLHNALCFCASKQAIDRSTPIAEIAYLYRLAILEEIQPAEVGRNLAVTREMFERDIAMLLSEPYELLHSVSNWVNAWHGVDFSGAVVASSDKIKNHSNSGFHENSKAGGSGSSSSVGSPLVLGQSYERNHPIRMSSAITSKAEGGYWIDFAAPLKGMAAIDSLIKEDPNLETI